MEVRLYSTPDVEMATGYCGVSNSELPGALAVPAIAEQTAEYGKFTVEEWRKFGEALSNNEG